MWMKSSQNKSVSMAPRVHPFPSRTRKLSWAAPKILGWWRPGKIGRRRHKRISCPLLDERFAYSSIAQSVEHSAVNRRVVGSSPTWGAKRKADAIRRLLSFFIRLALIHGGAWNTRLLWSVCPPSLSPCGVLALPLFPLFSSRPLFPRGGVKLDIMNIFFYHMVRFFHFLSDIFPIFQSEILLL